MHGPGIELAKGVAKPPAVDLSHDVSCGLFVEYRPEADRVCVPVPRRPPEEKHRRMLGLDNERFQPARSHNSEIRVGHEDLSTMIH